MIRCINCKHYERVRKLHFCYQGSPISPVTGLPKASVYKFCVENRNSKETNSCGMQARFFELSDSVSLDNPKLNKEEYLSELRSFLLGKEVEYSFKHDEVILVHNYPNDPWVPRHFCRMDLNRAVCYCDGTSFLTSGGKTLSWKYYASLSDRGI